MDIIEPGIGLLFWMTLTFAILLFILAKFAWDKGATEGEMADVMKLLRQAQWRWDFAVASHGASFHAPVETQRILAHSLDKSYMAQMAIKKVLYSKGVTLVISFL